MANYYLVTEDDLNKALESGQLTVSGQILPKQAGCSPKKKKMTASELPETAKSLPVEAQEMFAEIFNATEADEDDSYRAAWRFVKDRFERTEKGWETKKMLNLDPQASILGPHVGDVDQLRRQLVTDGYEEVADMISGDAATSVAILQLLPNGYRQTIVDRYLNARKSTGNEYVSVAIKALNSEKKITYGVVYPPEEVDLQKEWAKPEIIEKAAHQFLTDWRQQDTFHDEQAGKGTPVESYIVPCDLYEFHGVKLEQPIKKGTWIMATKWEPEAWEQVKEGKITGYSIGGFKKVRR